MQLPNRVCIRIRCRKQFYYTGKLSKYTEWENEYCTLTCYNAEIDEAVAAFQQVMELTPKKLVALKEWLFVYRGVKINALTRLIEMEL